MFRVPQCTNSIGDVTRRGRDIEPENGELFTNGIKHLYHVICPGRLAVSDQTINVIRSLKHPSIVTELP